MGRVVKLSIRARGIETDAPTIDDFLDQVRDYFDILKGVEESIAEDRRNAIEWRIIGASKNSPLALEAEAFPREHGVDITRRADLTVRHTAWGLNALRETGERPAYFTDRVLQRAEQLFRRVTNGLDETSVDFGDDLPPLELTPAVARTAAGHVQQTLRPPDRPYRELGSVEGYVTRVERDGHGRQILRVAHRLTGEDVKCIVTGEALRQVGAKNIEEVWRQGRVLVSGTLYFKALGRLSSVEATSVRFLRKDSELPDLDDILDENFTGGLATEEYLERLRNGEFS